MGQPQLLAQPLNIALRDELRVTLGKLDARTRLLTEQQFEIAKLRDEVLLANAELAKGHPHEVAR